jgi:hypothetical protein
MTPAERWKARIAFVEQLGFGFPELIQPRVDAARYALQGRRLNLVLPIGIDQWAFGGPATALRLFEKMSEEFEYARIIFLNQNAADFDAAGWPQWTIDDGSLAEKSLAFGASASLPVTANDYFLATGWNTAVYVKHVMAGQAALFPEVPRRFVYFIQDYEPGFFPHSARYQYARSTYNDGDRIIAVFNSRSLADYFDLSGLRFSEQHVFEPTLNPRLLQMRLAENDLRKERLLLVYGRPAVPRNDFDLVVEALKVWARTYPTASQWSVISAGFPHADIPLSGPVVLKARGKLTLDEYADHLFRCWTGLSLMFSPHPSYPPLEMAEFGAWVVTNSFENKNLSTLSPNIVSVDDPTPAAVAERLSWCCDQYQPGRTAVLDNLGPVFRGEGDGFPFAKALVSSWTQAG